MADIKKIGVLTSGGDCAGLNAVIRAVAYHAIQFYGWTVIGIQDGTSGLIERPLRYRELTLDTFGTPFEADCRAAGLEVDASALMTAIAAIQELSVGLDAQVARIARLEADNAALRAQLQRGAAAPTR